MLAKICTDMNKPDGQTFLKFDKQEVINFMGDLSVRKIPGIGRMTELELSAMDIFKCKDILEKAVEIFISFTERSSGFLIKCALGIARNIHEEDDDDGIQKSISHSETFKPVYTIAEFKDKIKEVCETLAERVIKR